MGFPCGSAGKESSCNAGDLSSVSGLGRSPGEGKAIPSSILAWRIPCTWNKIREWRAWSELDNISPAKSIWGYAHRQADRHCMLQTVKVQSLWFFNSNLLPLTFSKILAFYLIFVFRAALEGRLLKFHFPHFTVETGTPTSVHGDEEQAAELILAAPPVAVLLATFHPPSVHTRLPSSLVLSLASLHHLLSQVSFLNHL